LTDSLLTRIIPKLPKRKQPPHGRPCCGFKRYIELGVIACPLNPSGNTHLDAVIAVELMMPSSLPTWFNAAIVVNYVSLTEFAQAVVTTKVEKSSRSKKKRKSKPSWQF